MEAVPVGHCGCPSTNSVHVLTMVEEVTGPTATVDDGMKDEELDTVQ
jgi:hypothetical protein